MSVQMSLFDVGSVFLNSAMVGCLALDVIRLVTSTKLTAIKQCMIVAALFLLTSLSIDSFTTVLPADSKPYVDQLSTYTYLVALTLVVYILVMRSKAIHVVLGKFSIIPYLTYGIGPLYLVIRLIVNIINTMIASAAINHQDNPVSPLVRQLFRTMMNVLAMGCVLFYESFTTFYLFRYMDGDAMAYKSQRMYSIFMTFLITTIFFVQTLLQINRIWSPSAWAPFHGISWSLMLKRILDFKDEYESLLKSHQSSKHRRQWTSSYE
ncbi:hypothetical protein HDU91_003545 [Kappamyces sp. JEL0680]|nr:hypothetical protein HDU91_003545 [Kappamyces sp. JEL0680]